MTAKRRVYLVLAMAGLFVTAPAQARPAPASTNVSGTTQGARGAEFRRRAEDSTNIVKLGSIRLRDVCILPDQASKTYYMVGPGGRSVRVYTSKDLVNWQGPRTIFRPATNVWGDIPVVGIWAPEMHAYKAKAKRVSCSCSGRAAATPVTRPALRSRTRASSPAHGSNRRNQSLRRTADTRCCSPRSMAS